MGQVIEYKTPLVQIRGVFLCENVADTAVSARGSIVQEDWDVLDDEEVGAGTNTDGNIAVLF
jgi:hypothetical protein